MRRITYLLCLFLLASVPATNSTISAFGSINKAIGILAVVVWICSLALGGRIRRSTPYIGVLCAFTCWNLLSATWSNDLLLTLNHTLRYFQFFAMSLMLWDTFREERQVFSGMQAYVVGCYFSVALTVKNYHAQQVFVANQGAQRFSAGDFDVNDLAVALVLAIPLAWSLAINYKGKSRIFRLMNYCYPAVAGLGIILTNSRSAVLASIPGIIYILSTLPRINYRAKIGLILAVLGCIGYMTTLNLSGSFKRLQTLTTSLKNDGASGRLGIWRRAIRQFGADPVLGVGGGAFPSLNEGNGRYSNLVVHNTYLSVLAELGIIGFGLFALLFYHVARAAARAPTAIRSAWVAALWSLVMGLFTLTWEFRPMIWTIFMMVIAAGSVQPAVVRLRAARSIPTHKVAPAVDGAPA